MPDPTIEPAKSASKEPSKEPEPTKEPTKVEPGKEPVKEPTKEPAGKVQDPLSVKLEGDTVPEKFKGKTLGEVLMLMGTTDSEVTKLQQENKQWQEYFRKKEEEAAAPKEKPFNPLEHFEEDQARAVLTIVDSRMKPALDGLSGIMCEYAKSLYPDFEEHEERIKKVYDEMIPEFKFNPKYGWPWAYRFVKAEVEGTPAPSAVALPTPGPSATAPGPEPTEKLTEEEKAWAKKMQMSEEDYYFYKTANKPKGVK